MTPLPARIRTSETTRRTSALRFRGAPHSAFQRRLVMASPRICGSDISTAILTRRSETDNATSAGYLRKKARMPSRFRGLTRGRGGFDCVILKGASFYQSGPFAIKIFTPADPPPTLERDEFSRLLAPPRDGG